MESFYLYALSIIGNYSTNQFINIKCHCNDNLNYEVFTWKGKLYEVVQEIAMSKLFVVQGASKQE